MVSLQKRELTMNVSETNRISFIDKSVKLRKVKDVEEL